MQFAEQGWPNSDQDDVKGVWCYNLVALSAGLARENCGIKLTFGFEAKRFYLPTSNFVETVCYPARLRLKQ
jgi:hypothetical protein